MQKVWVDLLTENGINEKIAADASNEITKNMNNMEMKMHYMMLKRNLESGRYNNSSKHMPNNKFFSSTIKKWSAQKIATCTYKDVMPELYMKKDNETKNNMHEDTLYKCKKCKCATDTCEMQVRSADEGMTLWITCRNPECMWVQKIN